ncbi:MAG TPA: DnaA/Hda family protein [Alphaproteobacteria bacterium]|nr:DnaA/Hda family protein [Alphaproteobacteria bacterium]
MNVAQYPLPLPHREAMEADDFLVASSNKDAVAWIDRWPDWPAHGMVVYGPAGAGKTHLAHVWRSKSRGKVLAAEDIGEADPGLVVMSNRALVIEDAACIGGRAEREQALLHIYNMLRENGGSMLLTARRPPAHWNIALPDLRSRLLAAPAIALLPPDDDLLIALLVKQFRDRQIDIGAEVVDYLLSRVERSPGAVRQLVVALDRASLATGRKITIALARRVIETINAA